MRILELRSALSLRAFQREGENGQEFCNFFLCVHVSVCDDNSALYLINHHQKCAGVFAKLFAS